MKFNQLRDFVAVAEAGSLRGASSRLGVAQPAITRSVQELERGLCSQLFIRGARGVTLTPVGQVFLTRAQGILEEVRRAREEVEQISGGSRGELVVALSTAAHFGVLPRVLRRFRRRYPEVRIRLIEGFLPMLEADLDRGRIDFYVGPHPQSAVSATLRIEKVLSNERVLVARAGHPRAATTRLSDLTDADWLTTSITRDAAKELNSFFAERGLPPPRLLYHCQTALSVLSVMLNTDTLAMLPRQWVDSPAMRGVLVELPVGARFPAPNLVLVRKAGLGLTPAGQHFVDLIRTVADPAPSS